MDAKGKIHSFESFGAVDGPGIRYAVFFQGCPLRCCFCHNPDTWSFDKGTVFTVNELVEQIKPYRPFLNGGGVTLTGGEPLAQPEFAARLLETLHAEGFHTAIDTAGSVPLDQCRQAVDAADMLLLDIKAMDSRLCNDMCGSNGDNAKQLLAYCEEKQKPVWLRHVLVPGFTLTCDRLTALAEYLRAFTCVQKVELLPFHQLGRYKWEALKYPYPLKDLREPTVEECIMAKKIFLNFGFQVH